MLRTRYLLLIAVVVSLLGAACSSDGGKDTRSACKPKGDERPAKAVLRCTESSVAYVETEVASGTAVVVEVDEKRYLLTNQHVVDPFDAADATIGERSYEDLPVLGVDIGADIAILGPLTGDNLPDPLTISDGTGLERGDEVFLVGFPGESNSDELEATIASGIVSRLRSVKEFDQSYIQTDASIGGGQSGGPLFDGAANLVGISGLSFAEEFALALAGRDVKTAMRQIVEGDGDEYLSVPATAGTKAGSTSGTVKLYDANDGQVLFLPAAPDARTWHLSVDMAAGPVVSVMKLADEEPMAVSSNTATVQGELARQLADTRGGDPGEIFDPAALGIDPNIAGRETEPGSFTIPVQPDESALVVVAVPLTDAPVELAWQSDLPLVPASRPVSEETIEVGGEIDRIIGGLDTAVDVFVSLEAGQRVRLHAQSPQGDPGFYVFEPGRKLDHLTMADPDGAGIESYDDTDDGLYGLNAKTTLTAKMAGTYRFRIFNNEFNSALIRFSVEDCGKVECDEKASGKK